MDDKERLEEIKKHRNDADNSTDEYEFEKINFYNLHVDWLIEQAERVQELETAVDFYQSALRDADRRVQELEEELYGNNIQMGYKQMHSECNRDYAKLRHQNKRYREALELLVKQETLGKDAKTGKTAISYNGMIALKGLGIFNDDVYTVYEVDEVIESVLEDEK